MNLAVEIKTENVETPGLVFELADSEARHEVGRILDWVEQHPDQVGYDDPLLREMVEKPDEPDSGIHAIKEQLEDNKKVVLQGEIGKAVIHAVEVVAECESPQAPQIPALRILNLIEHEAPEPDSKEVKELSFADQYLLRRMNDESRLNAQRDASGKREFAIINNEQQTPIKPEPIWVDYNGRELAQGEYFRIHNAEEVFATSHAIKLMRDEEASKGKVLTTGFEEMDENIAEGHMSFDLKGEEAQVARRALKLVASGLLQERDLEKDQNKMLRKQAKRMLDIRKQGPKQLEVVEFDPVHQIQFSGDQFDVPKQKPKLELVHDSSANELEHETNESQDTLAA